MRSIIAVILLLVSFNVQAFFWGDKSLTEKTVNYWQPDTDENYQIPERPYNIYSYERQLKFANLNHFKRSFSTYNNKGTLFSSWNPIFNPKKPVPTVIIIHGGHGLTPLEFQSAKWFKEDVGANVLVLDSFWSRGKEQNHNATNQHGVNTMILDLIAAQRWLETQPEVDPRFIYVYGGSLGGWASLRLMTDDPFITKNVKGKIKAAFSMYPFCRESPRFGGIGRMHHEVNLDFEPWFAPNLGPYHSNVYVFTGGKDTATSINDCNRSIFTEATYWAHYEEGTHAWDVPNRNLNEPSVNGLCSRAKNPTNRFNQCRDDRITNEVREKIKSVIYADLNN
jgi:dienelactone hydrolase